jgi:glucans biosynthesis protein
MSLRTWLVACLALGLLKHGSGAASQVTLDYVARLAQERAARPFRSPKADLPSFLRPEHLDYDKYREIEFRHEKALWAAEGLPYRVEFFHPGYLYQEPVQIHEFTLTRVQPVRFVQDFFNYRGLQLKKRIPPGLGYAGFRLLYRLNAPDRWDELGAFLGASYFRLLGRDQRYGPSARGLALDCGETDRAEEFPLFTDWWLGKPHRDDTQLRLYGLLDSVSCTGAFEFLIEPGETTVADVEAVLFFRAPELVKAVAPERKPVATVGLAPLTSMFWFGKSSDRKFDDYRPEVHDSDGLLIQERNGEHLWRPLANPRQMRHQRFELKQPRGFGLLQRERAFACYQDLFNLYHQVPSIWVQPRGDWGEGAVHLVELSTHYEGLDNVVAFWDPKLKPRPGQPFRYGYTLYWTLERDLKLSTERVVATRVGAHPRFPTQRQFAVDFAGPKLAALKEDSPPRAVATCTDNATIKETQVFYNRFEHCWRVMLSVEPRAGNQDAVDLRLRLYNGSEPLSETWAYLWSP